MVQTWLPALHTGGLDCPSGVVPGVGQSCPLSVSVPDLYSMVSRVYHLECFQLQVTEYSTNRGLTIKSFDFLTPQVVFRAGVLGLACGSAWSSRSRIFPSLLFLCLSFSLHDCKRAVAAPGITPSQGPIQSRKQQSSPPASIFFFKSLEIPSYVSLVSNIDPRESEKVSAIFSFCDRREISSGRKKEEGSGCRIGSQQCLPW